MSDALAILTHALRMLLFDVSRTIRLLLPTILMVMVSGIILSSFAYDTIFALDDTTLTPPPAAGQNLLLFAVFGVIALLSYALMAVLWHRHVLINGAERPDARLYFGYIWRAVVVGAFQVLAAIPVMAAIGMAGLAVGTGFGSASATDAVATLLGFVGTVVLLWIGLRVSLVLPAAALGQTLSIRESWDTTQRISTPLWGVGLLLTGINTALYYVTAPLLVGDSYLVFGLQTALFIAEGLVFISVLTTLYGYLIENRSLGQ